jgi:hypothetical protein
MRAIALLLLGIGVGVLGAIVQAQRLTVGSVMIPTGLVVALAVLVPIARAGAWWLESRFGALCIGVGWLIGTLSMGTSSPWGDLVLDSGTRQLSYLIIGSGLMAAAVSYPVVDRHAARPQAVPETAASPAAEPPPTDA